MSDGDRGVREVRRAERGRSSGPLSGVADEDSFDELRSLLIGPEQRGLLELQSHLLDPSVQTRDVSRVLPDALALAVENPRLAQTLAPLIADSITTSVRKDPRPLADALFPVIGPAIRKAISRTLAAMMDSLSRSVEQSLSWRALQWRWTAWKTGKPFGEIVLLNTLSYRVEQLFLIHEESGLLLQHVTRQGAAGSDVDQVSAMLTAIQDFVRDSFQVGREQTLDALRVGELAVLVERGPHAVLAAVVRGNPPLSIRSMLQDALEAVHRQLGAELKEFRGDSSPFEKAKQLLEACLVAEFREPRPRSRRGWLLAGAVVLFLAGLWLAAGLRDRQRWSSYIERLRREPGIIVVSTGRSDGRFVVSGLRDPLAADPGALLASVRLSADRVAARWEPYEAIHAPFIAERAKSVLRPPAGVMLSYRDGLLTARGPAPAQWVVDSERLAPALAGVRRLEYAGPAPDLTLKERIEQRSVLFVRGTSSFAPGQEEELRALAGLLNELDYILHARGRRAQVEVRGQTDSDGSDALNAPLSESRAAALVSALWPVRFVALDFSTRGLGSAQPTIAAATEEDKQRNRRASVHVVLPAAGGAQPTPAP